MTDPYLIQDNVVARLVREWRRYGRILIAYDFDDTVFDCHGVGSTHEKVINLLKTCKDIGALFIVNTCRGEEDYEFVKKYLDEKGLPYDKINENFDFAGVTGTKVYANIVLDDKAGLPSAYEALRVAALEMSMVKEVKHDSN